MAFIHGKNAAVLHGSNDLSSYLNSAQQQTSVATAETTAFGNSAKTYITGLEDSTLSASGMFDGAAGAVDEILSASLGSDTLSPVLLAPIGIALGNRVILGQSKTTSYQVSSPVGDVVSVSYDAQLDGGADYGVALTALSAVTATTTGTAVDNSASTANGGIAQLHVTANTWSANATIKVQHSVDNSAWVDLATFTVVATTVKTSERVAVAAGTTVNRYLRAVNTLSTGTGSITYQVSFARR